MSWLFSQALVAEYSAASCLAGEPCALLKTTPTPQAFCAPDKMTGFSRPSRFGMTFVPLTDGRGEALLTWFLEGFHVKTSAPPAKVADSPERAADYGWKWPESLAKYDPALRLWRTRQCSLLEDSDEFLETWPRWASMLDGELLPLPTLERHTSENESGLWPTPNASKASNDLTLTCSGDGRAKPNKLGWAVAVAVWPTPTTTGNNNAPKHGTKRGTGLATAVKQWPTPTAVTNTGGAALCKWGGSGAREKLRSMVTPQELNGALNPTWVEWLMGWPQGWTDLQPLETDKCRSAPLLRSGT